MTTGPTQQPRWERSSLHRFAFTNGSTDRSRIDFDPHPDRGPLIHPGRNVHGEAHAAVAHGCAEVVVPVSAVESMAEIGEVHDVWHVRHVVILAAKHTLHCLRRQLRENVEFTGRGLKSRATGADKSLPEDLVALIGPEVLEGDADLYPLFAVRIDRAAGDTRDRSDEEIFAIGRQVALGDRGRVKLEALDHELADRQHVGVSTLLLDEL